MSIAIECHLWYYICGGDDMSREITPAQRAAVGRYESANYDKVLVRIPKGERDKIKAAANLLPIRGSARLRQWRYPLARVYTAP